MAMKGATASAEVTADATSMACTASGFLVDISMEYCLQLLSACLLDIVMDVFGQ
jgi:hypothetical protein